MRTDEANSYHSKEFDIICERETKGFAGTYSLNVILPDGTLHWREEHLTDATVKEEVERLKMRMFINPDAMEKRTVFKPSKKIQK
jgi:hypothetical protein